MTTVFAVEIDLGKEMVVEVRLDFDGAALERGWKLVVRRNGFWKLAAMALEGDDALVGVGR